MTAPNSNRMRSTAAFLMVLVYAGIIFGGSSGPVPPAIADLEVPDTLLHLVEYAVLGLLLARWLRLETGRSGYGALVLVPGIVAALYGLTDEIHQSFVEDRSASLADLWADTAGGLVGALSYRLFVSGRLVRARRAAAAAVVLCLAAGGVAAEDGPSVAERLRVHRELLGSEELRSGPGPYPGQAVAGRYVAEHLRHAGLTPGGEGGGWFLAERRAVREDQGKSLVRVFVDGASREFGVGDVAIARRSPDGDASGPLVFGGFGVEGADRDDLKELDLRGRVVLVLAGDPRRGESERGIAEKAAAIAKRGAVGLLVAPHPVRDLVDRVRLTSGEVLEGELRPDVGGVRILERRPGGGGGRVRRIASAAVAGTDRRVLASPRGVARWSAPPDGPLPLPVLRISGRAAGALLAGTGHELLELAGALEEGPAGFEVAGRIVVARVRSGRSDHVVRHVAGRWPGRQRNEVVLVRAAFGGADPAGASTDGRAAAALLAVAETVASEGSERKRPILFLAMAGGGSEVPPGALRPAERVVATVDLGGPGVGPADRARGALRTLSVLAGPAKDR